MILTKEQAEKRISSQNNIVNKLEESKNAPAIVVKTIGVTNPDGRGQRADLTEEEKLAVGVLARTEGAKIAAEVLGISVDTVRNISSGSRFVHTVDDDGFDRMKRIKDPLMIQKIQERIDETKLIVSEVAAERLMKSLGLLTDEKLEKLTAKDLASVGSQVSQIVRNMNPAPRNAERGDGTPNIKIVLNKPKEAREESFDIIEVKVS